MNRTVPVSSASEQPATFAGRNASQRPQYDSATASTALGSSTEAMGIISALAGSAVVVARWKYHAIGSASAKLMTIETKSSSEALSTTRVAPTRVTFARRLPTTLPSALRNSRISTRNCAARVGCE